MSRISAKGRWSHALLRGLTRFIFAIAGLFASRKPRPGDALSWQAALISRMANLVVPYRHLTIRGMRRLYRLQTIAFNVDAAVMEEVEELDVNADLRVRLYRPFGAPSMGPALLYFHGGGYVIGCLRTHDTLCRYIASGAKMVVIAVDYGLAPERPFPAALDDATAAFDWLVAGAGKLGVDAARIALGGDSAGGGLVASMALERRWKVGGPGPAGLWMVYPWLEIYGAYPSHQEFEKKLLLAKPLIDLFQSAFPGPGVAPDDIRHSPGLAGDVSQLPPTFLMTAGHDPLRDEGLAFAEKLKAAGVPLIHDHRPRLLHEFLSMGGVVPEARVALDEAIATLAEMLGHSET